MIEKVRSVENSNIFVAEEAGELIGFAGIIGQTLEREQHSAQIFIGVLEKSRGKGVASALFKEIFRWAREKNIQRLGLTVMTNNLPAIQLYRKRGFKIEGERVHSLIIDGEPVNEYYMYKLLPKRKS